MQGYNVLHPMGFDAFGLPAENEALAKGLHPAPMVHKYGENYRRQMELVGIGFDWTRSFYSSDPAYYRWTQWFFKLLFERGLAYRKLAAVNWDPVENTVLADEEVIGGLGWRSGVPVEKRMIPQWYFNIVAYADKLLDDLESLDWPEGIKAMQRNWIGKSEGVEFRMKVLAAPAIPAQAEADESFSIKSTERQLSFEVFTTRIDTLFGVTFCVLAPEHSLVDQLHALADLDIQQEIDEYRKRTQALSDQDRLATGREKSGVFTGSYAINPATGEPVPIWIADYVLTTYGTGAIMAVPGHDARDYEFAEKFGLEIVPVISPDENSIPELPYVTSQGVLINSGEYTGLNIPDAQSQLSVWIEALGIGERRKHYRLRDWLISRQRYWGCPIPIIHTKDGAMQPVSDALLPVELPDVENYKPSGDGSSPLAHIPEFINVTDNDGMLGQRETDTMGGFACSSWYFLRFADPLNPERPFDQNSVDYWLPVDTYVGGAEHAVMHLLYARFWTKVLYDAGLVKFEEPFLRLQNQGQVLGKTPYRAPRENETLKVGEEGILIPISEANALPEQEVSWRWVRMSKSKGNVVTPDEAVEEFGADALRVCELFVAPFEQDIQWSNDGMHGAVRWLSRVFKLVSDLRPFLIVDWSSHLPAAGASSPVDAVRRATHNAIQQATEDIEAFKFNTYVSSLMIFVNELSEVRNAALKTPPDDALRAAISEAITTLILLLAPAAPHTADELWTEIGFEGFTYLQNWPVADPTLTQADVLTIAVQVNGKLRDTVEVRPGSDRTTLEQVALNSSKVQIHLQNLQVMKIIVVPDKLVNIVAK